MSGCHHSTTPGAAHPFIPTVPPCTAEGTAVSCLSSMTDLRAMCNASEQEDYALSCSEPGLLYVSPQFVGGICLMFLRQPYSLGPPLPDDQCPSLPCTHV
jgi:hypothetical protein